mmetsp:Transcript_6848/g.16845  ORF Transcript_6848/g.16845 Transcript_6848/m.16845 type:complete len:256 (-) Transcript_6848:113-880(-)
MTRPAYHGSIGWLREQSQREEMDALRESMRAQAMGRLAQKYDTMRAQRERVSEERRAELQTMIKPTTALSKRFLSSLAKQRERHPDDQENVRNESTSDRRSVCSSTTQTQAEAVLPPPPPVVGEKPPASLLRGVGLTRPSEGMPLQGLCPSGPAPLPEIEFEDIPCQPKVANLGTWVAPAELSVWEDSTPPMRGDTDSPMLACELEATPVNIARGTSGHRGRYWTREKLLVQMMRNWNEVDAAFIDDTAEALEAC